MCIRDSMISSLVFKAIDIAKCGIPCKKLIVPSIGSIIQKLEISLFFSIPFSSLIIEELKKARPNYSIISEENGIEKNKDTSNSWIIDPIDGTINFLHGIPHFAISIALRANDEIICGLIYDPIKDEMFYAEKNNGTFLNNQRVRVSKKNNFEDCLFAIGGKLNTEPNFVNRRSGSAALDLAYVAAGRYDGYFQKNLNLWDIAAGIILVKEAGGIIDDLNLDNIKNVNVKASNPNISGKFNEKVVNF